MITHYLVRETARHSGAEIIETEKVHPFSFASVYRAEHFLMTRVVSLKKNGYKESFRNRSEDDKTIKAMHVFNNDTMIKIEIIPVEFIP